MSARPAGRPRVLVVAGLNPTGRAGLVADLEAARAVGADAFLVASALTAQGPRGARGFEPAGEGTVLAGFAYWDLTGRLRGRKVVLDRREDALAACGCLDVIPKWVDIQAGIIT